MFITFLIINLKFDSDRKLHTYSLFTRTRVPDFFVGIFFVNHDGFLNTRTVYKIKVITKKGLYFEFPYVPYW